MMMLLEELSSSVLKYLLKEPEGRILVLVWKAVPPLEDKKINL